MPKRLPTATDPVTTYAVRVVTGQVVAGPHVRNAAKRHLLDLERGAERGLFFDVDEAQRVIGFFRDVLRLNGGQFEGMPFNLHEAQQFIIGSIFGWKRRTPDGAVRRFRRAYLEMAKGQGKSPMMAGIGMWCLLADKEPRAEVYAAASKKDQAMVLFRDAVAMFEMSPALARRLTPSGANPVWNLSDLRTGSFFRPISSDDGQSGPRPSCALLDEVHEHRNSMMLEMMERGFKFRRQPLMVMATNSGSDRKSICWQEHQHAVRVAAGTREPDDQFTFVGEVIDDTTFSYVCALDKDDDPLEDPSCWVKANPLLGTTVTEDYLRLVVEQAKAIPGKLNNILRLHFCVWTDSDTAWMSRPALEACLDDFDPTEFSGEKVWLGLDLSASQDITALAYVSHDGVDEKGRQRYALWVDCWTPADTLAQRALRDQTPYDLWAADGWLETTPGRLIGMDFVAARISEATAIYDVQQLAYDAYGFKRNLEPELDRFGVTVPMAEHPQGGKKRGATGLWMPGSKKLLEDLILERRIRIRHSPPIISAFMSATVEGDPFGNSWFSKRKATARIDALIASAMAIGAASEVASGGKSWWEEAA